MDLETDTHPTATPQSTFPFTEAFLQDFADKIIEKCLNSTKVDEYVNDSISEWMNNEFDISDHLDRINTDEIVDKVVYELESRIEVESTIRIS